MSTDISVTINPPNQIPVSIGAGITRHAPSHAPGASDSLEAYYITGNVIRPSDTGQFVWTGSTGNFVTGAVVRPSETGKFITSGQTGALTGSFYPLSSNPNGYVQGAVVRPSNTGAFLDTGSSQTIGSLKNFLIRPTVNGTGVLLSGEGGGAVNTGSLTGVFYPLNSNPSGYITGVDLSNYVTKSSTGSFVTTGQTGNFVTVSQTGQFVSTGATGNFVTGSVVRPNETGAFITTSQTGNFATNDKTVFLTGDQTISGIKSFSSRPNVNGTGVLLSGEAVAVETGSLTGAFYPLNSNPSGYITGVDLSNYVTKSSTGVFVTTGQTGAFVTGSVVRPSETGAFITSSQTGQFYASSNPSGYSTTGYVTGVSGYLQNQISFVRTGGASDYYVTLTGAQNISGAKTFYDNAVFKSGLNLSGKLLFDTGYSPTVIDGEISWNSDYNTAQIGMNGGNVVNPIGFKNFYRVKAHADIRKGKVIMAVGTNGNSEFIIAQEASNIGSSGELIMGVSAEAISANSFGDVVSFGAVKGVDTSAFASGAILYFDTSSTGGFTAAVPSAPNAKVITAINLNPSSNGTVFVRVSAGSVLGGTDSNVKFSSLQDNNIIAYSSGSGFWYNKTLSTGDISGISAYALAENTGSFITSSQTGQFVSTGATGSFVISSQTGSFLTTGAADNRYVLQSSTGSFITTGQTGQFLTTGAADARYYSSSNGQVISGYATTGFNDAVTGMAISGDATKTITLFKRVGTITASFTDNTGSAGGSGAVVAVKSAIKTDTQSLASNTWTDISGLSISYTPTSASNKILVVASIQGGCSVANCAAAFRLVRDSTAIGVADAASNRIQASAIAYPVQDGLLVSAAMSVLDAPASTSSITYKVQFRRFYDSGSGTVYVNRSNSDVDATNYARCASTITIYEVIP